MGAHDPSAEPRDSSSVADGISAIRYEGKGLMGEDRTYLQRANRDEGMGKVDKKRRSKNVMPSKGFHFDHSRRRKRSGIYLESTEPELLDVLPDECTRVKDAMSRSVYTVTPSTQIKEAVWLMKSLGVGSVIVCDGSTLIGTLSDRDIALANAHPSEPIHKVMSREPVFCHENHLLLDVHEMMRTLGFNALAVRDFSGTLSGIVLRTG